MIQISQKISQAAAIRSGLIGFHNQLMLRWSAICFSIFLLLVVGKN